VLLSSFFASAQIIPGSNRLDTLFTPPGAYHYYKPEVPSNEVAFVFHLFYSGYKKFISSQDSQSCSFTPSCSEYAVMAIRTNGLVKGMLMSFDRLQRCNGFKSERYSIDAKRGLKIDPL
jgi:putative membrane protein insertion efficiency factor